VVTNGDWWPFTLGVVGLTGLEPVTPRLSSVCSNQLSYRPGGRIQSLEFRVQNRNSKLIILNSKLVKAGGGNRIRTDDILLAKQTLYQLSYTPECWHRAGRLVKAARPLSRPAWRVWRKKTELCAAHCCARPCFVPPRLRGGEFRK